MTERTRPLRVALIGFGEVGRSFGAGLKVGGADVAAYDKAYQSATFGELIRRSADEARIPLASSVGEVIAGADLILAMVPGAVALDTAREALPALSPGQLYADLGSASPPVKEQLAQLVEAAGASFVDVAILGSPTMDGFQVACLVSGKDAARYREIVTPFGMKVEVAGERPGRAAAIKMFRSILMKGIEALILEAAIACRTWDVTDEVMSSVSKTLGKQPFYPDWVAHSITGDAIHAGRRAHEMDMVIETMKSVGVEPRMTRATAEMIHWSADLGLREHYGGKKPQDWQAVIEEMVRRSS